MYKLNVRMLVFAIIFNKIAISLQSCESKSCVTHSQDLAHRMWSMEALRESVFTVYMRELARSRHYQLALWHMSVAGDLRSGKLDTHSLSNQTGFVEPDITEVYRKEIEQVVQGYVSEHHDQSLHELGLDESVVVIDKLWAMICGGKLAITQSLIAAILRRQKAKLKLEHEVKEQFNMLTEKLYNNEIPPGRWEAIVMLTDRSLCESDVCPWLHRIVDQTEQYLIENSDDTNYLTRVAHIVKGYCGEQSYAVLDELIGHHREADCSRDSRAGFQKEDSEIVLLLPNPSDKIDDELFQTPGNVINNLPASNPYYGQVDALIKVLNTVPYKDIRDKFDKINSTKLDFFSFLINHHAVQEKLKADKTLEDFAKAYKLLLNISKGNIEKPFAVDFDDLSNLTKYFPNPENTEQTNDLEELKKLLSDYNELSSLFGENPDFSDTTSDRHLLERIIRKLLTDPEKSKYDFTDALYDILENIIDDDKEEYLINRQVIMHTISPLDTLIVLVDPSRLDRKPRFAAPGGYYSEEVDRPRSKYTLEYTLPSPVLSSTEEDLSHLENLIPLDPHENNTRDYELMQACRDLLADPDVRNIILEPNFDLRSYPTKILLLEYVFRRINALHDAGDISTDPVIEDFIQLYFHILEFTNEELGPLPMAVMRNNYAELLKILPKPDMDDIPIYEALQSFLLDDDHLDYVLREINPKELHTQGELLKYILERCSQFVEDSETRRACSYYSSRILDVDQADELTEKYVVYRKSNFNRDGIVYVQLNQSNPGASKVTPQMQPPHEGILQIPVPNAKLGIAAMDMLRPSHMVPDVDSSFEMYYNITDLKWQIRRDDSASNIFEETFDWREHSTKVSAIEEVVDRLIALGLSDDIYMQPHSLQFAQIYALALKVANGDDPSDFEKTYDYVSLLDATKDLTDDTEFKEKCEFLKTMFEDHDIMQDVLGSEFYPHIYKNGVTVLRAVLHKYMESDDDDMEKARKIAYDILEFLKQLGSGYDIRLVTTVEHKEVDISDCMEAAFDRKALPKSLWTAFRDIMQFMIHEMDVVEHLSDFDFSAYHTKGELVEAMLKALVNEKTAPQNILEAAEQLLPYVNFDGTGAQKIN